MPVATKLSLPSHPFLVLVLLHFVLANFFILLNRRLAVLFMTFLPTPPDYGTVISHEISDREVTPWEYIRVQQENNILAMVTQNSPAPDPVHGHSMAQGGAEPVVARASPKRAIAREREKVQLDPEGLADSP
mmetsp:Transcript_423/g.930  ORF Transcript_423/g.930 Transcript_423/m.930 type:complete len:132 (-) Transcript_423:1596-1991(-)